MNKQNAAVAQVVEHRFRKARVESASLSSGSWKLDLQKCMVWEMILSLSIILVAE